MVWTLKSPKIDETSAAPEKRLSRLRTVTGNTDPPIASSAVPTRPPRELQAVENGPR